MSSTSRVFVVASGFVAALFIGLTPGVVAAARPGNASRHVVSDIRPAANTRVSDDACRGVQYNGWKGVSDPSAIGGAYCMSQSGGIDYRFTASSVQWVAHKGPNQGRAKVYVDGYSKGKVDLYAPVGGRLTKTYGSLGPGLHALEIYVLGRKNAASSATNVSIDAFIAGGTVTQETGCGITYDSWRCATATGAFGGTVHVSSWAGARFSLAFTGSSITWVTRTGPNFGKVQVFIDRASRGTVDLYTPIGHSRVTKAFSGLSAGAHTIVIEVLHRRNQAAHGFAVNNDGFTVPNG